MASKLLGQREFSIVLEDGSYSVVAGDCLLRTPAGKIFKSPNGALIRQFITELGSSPHWEIQDGIILAPLNLGIYTLYASQIDYYEYGNGLACDEVRKLVLNDSILHPQPGPEQLEQRFAWAPIYEILEEKGLRTGCISSYSTVEKNALMGFAVESWSSLSVSEKTVVNTLAQVNHSLLSAIALVTGRIDEDQYAHSILATTILHGVFGFPFDDDTSPEEMHARSYTSYRDQARTCSDYLRRVHIREAEIKRLIEQGESERIEFKETALGRPGAKKQEQDSAKNKIVRTLAAFLSGDGGTLILGINKEGRACGLPELEERSIDSVQLAIADILAARLTMEFASKISMCAECYEGKLLVVLRCDGSGKDVWLDDGENKIVLIRQGPRTTTKKSTKH